MAGVKNRSGGRNRKDAATHWREGTFDPRRHGPRPVIATATVQRQQARGDVPDDLVASLGPRGAAFVRDTFGAYSDWSPTSLTLLHEAGCIVDQLTSLRGSKGERSAQRLLCQLINSMRLED